MDVSGIELGGIWEAMRVDTVQWDGVDAICY